MSTLNVDALVGVTSANAITVRGEGTATTSLQQGLVKSWISANFVSEAYLDSFNQSTLADIAAGSYRFTVTNNFANANYACGTEARYVDANGINTMTQENDFTRTTSQYQAFCSNDGASVSSADTVHYQSLLAGDLA
jgi:predicted RNA methylase